MQVLYCLHVQCAEVTTYSVKFPFNYKAALKIASALVESKQQDRSLGFRRVLVSQDE